MREICGTQLSTVQVFQYLLNDVRVLNGRNDPTGLAHHRAHSATGSGMGLAMVHGIMHGQHGHVRVESIEGDGSEFRLFFKPAESLQTKAPLEPYLDVRKSPDNADKTILVVDDEVSLGDDQRR